MRSSTRLGLCCAAMAASQACYNYIPVESTPPVGQEVALSVSDRGRVSLAGRFGPGLAEIQGRLVRLQDSNYVINVFRVSQLSGSSALWAGEESRIDRDLVGSVRIRRLSVARTGALVGVTAVGLAILTARGLKGGGTETPVVDSSKGPASIRIPLLRAFHP